MPVTLNVNGLSVVHRGSNGVAMASAPDVCKTPGPGGPVPVPYPNVAMSSDLVGGTTTISVDGQPAAIQTSKFIKSTGDEPGAAGGVVSNVFAMEATFVSFSPTVMFEGKPVCRLTDKMLMNKGNTVCMGGVLQSPLPPAEPLACTEELVCAQPAPPPEAPKHCVLRSMLVSCGHSARELRIDLSRKDTQVLQIISPSLEPDTILVEWDASCGDNHPFCPDVFLDSTEDARAISKSSPVQTLKAPSRLLIRDWTWIFKVLVKQTEVTRSYYTVTALQCQGHDRADVRSDQWLQIQVFPEVEWKAKLSFSYKENNKKDAKGKEKPFEYDENSTWKFGGSVEATYGADKLKYEPEIELGVSDRIPIFTGLTNLIGRSAKIFESMANFGLDVTINPRWPKWEFGGGMKLVELPSNPLVKTEGSFKMAFDPLLGLEMKVSILDWLIRFAAGLAGPPGAVLAEVLVQIRKRFGKGFGDKNAIAQASLDIDIALTVGGQIGGAFGYKYRNGREEADTKSSFVEGSVDVRLEGHLIGTARVWRVVASGAGKVGIGSADGKEPSRFGAKLAPKAGADPFDPEGDIFFTGLAFYYLFYMEIGAAGGENTKREEHEDMGFTNKVSTTRKVYEKSGTCVLMQPWSWRKSA